MYNNILEIAKGVNYPITTLKISEVINRSHADILKTINGSVRSNGTIKQRGIIEDIPKDQIKRYFICAFRYDKTFRSLPYFKCTKDGLKLLLGKLRLSTEQVIKIRSELQLESLIVSNDKEETKFLDCLEDALSVFSLKGIKQKQVSVYRIDYYIQSINVAIEFDEGAHYTYDAKNEAIREQIIVNDLKCDFIRVSNHNSISYNIAYVIKEIMRLDKI